MPVKDAFLASVLAHVPETDRAKADQALTALEEGGLRQADYSRLAAEAKAEKEKFDGLYTKNVEWLEANKAALAEREALAAKLAELEAAPPPTKVDLPKDLITQKALTEVLNTMERGAVGFIAEANALTMQHYQQFGEILDMKALLADTRVNQIGIQGVYQDRFKEQIKAKVDAAQATRDEALRVEGETRARAALAASHHPYPVVGNEPSALDAIEAARAGKAPTVTTVEQMADEFARLSAARLTGTGSRA